MEPLRPLSNRIWNQGTARAEAIAIRAPGIEPISYRRLLGRAAAFARALREAGGNPGTRVVVQADKCADFLALFLGSLYARTVFVPLNPANTADEVRYYLTDCGATIFVGQPERAGGMEAVARESGVDRFFTLDAEGQNGSLQRALDVATASDPAFEAEGSEPVCILYTSGTTGRPKGATLTDLNLAATVEALHEAWGWGSDDVLLHALPLFHVHGLFIAACGALRAGSSMILLPRFDVDVVLEHLPESTVFMAVPTMYHRLVQSEKLRPGLCSGMRLFTSGSAPLSAQDFADFHQCTGHTIVERYGMTETGITISNPLNRERKPACIGFPLPRVEARIVDRETATDVARGEVGEIWMRGPSVFQGYFGKAEQTAESFVDGWFLTGDLARQDEDGYFQIVGRARDMIISGGLNVYPAEIEQVLNAIDGVEESAVVGLPDPDLGERVTAAIVRKPASRVAEEAVIAAARQRLAPYKCPRGVVFVESLPRNAMGKVEKQQLLESLRATA